MKDKERILMVIVSRIIPGLVYSFGKERDKYIESCMLNPEKLQKGDLVFANTAFEPNEFMVGFVERVEQNYVVIRELGSKRLCNYYNEGFTKINKKQLGYEILEGTQYQIYQKVLKAFKKYISSPTRFKSLCFDGNMCVVEGRKKFDDETAFKVSFPYSGKTSIKTIGEILVASEAAQGEQPRGADNE